MRYILVFFIFFILQSCNDIEFVYNDKKNLTNPLYENTKVSTTGLELAFLKSYIPMFFGNTKNEKYSLSILIQEEKIRRSVETNQAVSDLRYELKFFYEVKKIDENCVIFKKKVISSFSINPKSSGFNYGTDVSLQKKYELAVRKNINQFISYLTSIDLNSCL
tara:strand:+ start:998 stop:1486 length:489 start_codon:yes stop_codon:yes gene_type:complete